MRRAFLLPFFALAILLLACTQPPVDDNDADAASDNLVEEGSDDAAPEPLIGGDKDEHGCLTAAGYSWCSVKKTCLRMWEEECFSSAEEDIRYAFAEKYDRDPESVAITTPLLTDTHARGMVSFDAGEGGMYLAVKLNGVWVLAFDGNGVISCDVMEEYEFPADMIEDCAEE